MAFRWEEFGRSLGIHILEGIGVFASLRLSGPSIRGARTVRALCDNMAVVDAWRARRAREDPLLNEMVKLIAIECARYSVTLFLNYAESKKNTVADHFSK